MSEQVQTQAVGVDVTGQASTTKKARKQRADKGKLRGPRKPKTSTPGADA